MCDWWSFVCIVISGGGTVDFQEFVGGLSAFSSRGGREEKLRCKLFYLISLSRHLIIYISQSPSRCMIWIGMVSSQMVNYSWCWKWWWATIWRYDNHVPLTGTNNWLSLDLQDHQLQQIVDKTIMEADKDGDGKLSFDEFAMMVSNTVSQRF